MSSSSSSSTSSSSSSNGELVIDATNICGIVYELSRLAHDRQQMQHEDREGRLLVVLQRLKSELSSRDQTIVELERKITKNENTGSFVYRNTSLSTYNLYANAYMCYIYTLSCLFLLRILLAVYMKEKFRELRGFYEKSISAGDGAFIPTPMTAPSPPQKSTSSATIPSSSTSKASDTIINIKETNSDHHQHVPRYQGGVTVLNSGPGLKKSPKKSPPLAKTSPSKLYDPVYCLQSAPSPLSPLPETEVSKDIRDEGKKENVAALDLFKTNSPRKRGVTQPISSSPLGKRSFESTKLRRACSTNSHKSDNDTVCGDDNEDKKVSLHNKSKSISIGDTRSKNKSGREKIDKYVEVVRKKSEREELPGHVCEECEKYYNALQQGGMYNSPNSKAEVGIIHHILILLFPRIHLSACPKQY